MSKKLCSLCYDTNDSVGQWVNPQDPTISYWICTDCCSKAKEEWHLIECAPKGFYAPDISMSELQEKHLAKLRPFVTLQTIPNYDEINKPKHYNVHPSGIECIEVVRHMNYNLGNAIKYIWRAGLKEDNIKDLKKAAFYIQDEIKRLEENEKPISADNCCSPVCTVE